MGYSKSGDLMKNNMAFALQFHERTWRCIFQTALAAQVHRAAFLKSAACEFAGALCFH
jgi:hypothetical protein